MLHFAQSVSCTNSQFGNRWVYFVLNVCIDGMFLFMELLVTGRSLNGNLIFSSTQQKRTDDTIDSGGTPRVSPCLLVS